VLTVFLLLVPLQKLTLDGALRARLWRGFGAPLRPDRANGVACEIHSNSEMSSQIMPLNARADFADPRRISATETIRM
jgi:hypothetical protein